jgi:thymidylate kinase
MGKKAIPSGRTEAREKVLGKSWVRTVWLSLAMLDLALVYGFYMRWLGLTGKTVIADRYLVDTWIDFTLNFPGSNFDRWPLWKLLQAITPKPDRAFMLLIPVEESLRRSKLKDEPFPDSAEVLSQRLAFYEKFSAAGYGIVIDCMHSIDEISNQIVSIVREGNVNEG